MTMSVCHDSPTVTTMGTHGRVEASVAQFVISNTDKLKHSLTTIIFGAITNIVKFIVLADSCNLRRCYTLNICVSFKFIFIF